MPISAIVAGTEIYRPDFVRLRCTPGVRLTLVREPNHPYDVNAIAVKTSGVLGLFQTKIGNLKAPLAKRLAPFMDSGARPLAYVASIYSPPTFEHPRLTITIEMREVEDHPARPALQLAESEAAGA